MLSVSALNEQVKSLLEAHFSYVEVVGEISRLTKHSSGHWYFTLKDENSSVSAVMYKINNQRLKFDIKDGLKVIIYARVSLYAPSGSYQLIVSSMRPDGEGELELAFKQLKERLADEGLFDINLKKPMPKIPKRIGLITSATSAALADMLRILNERYLLADIFIFNSLTQGENAPSSLIKALKKADSKGLDVIVLARGGGSLEDLWCFNDEALVREIYKAKTPVVSAVGHEIDFVMTDFVADMRAPTPSAAINQLTPDQNQLMQRLDVVQTEILRKLDLKITKSQNKLNLLSSKLSTKALIAKIDLKISQIEHIKIKLKNSLLNRVNDLNLKLKTIENKFEIKQSFLNSTKELTQIRLNGKNVSLESLKKGDEIELVGQNITKKAVITN